jgi:hypothetical protein
MKLILLTFFTTATLAGLGKQRINLPLLKYSLNFFFTLINMVSSLSKSIQPWALLTVHYGASSVVELNALVHINGNGWSVAKHVTKSAMYSRTDSIILVWLILEHFWHLGFAIKLSDCSPLTSC